MFVIRIDSTIQFLYRCHYLICYLVVLQMVPTVLWHVQHHHLLVMHLDLLVTRSSLVATCGTMTVHWHVMRYLDTGLVVSLFSV